MVIACPHCGGRLTNDGSLSGQVVACALCGGYLHMPALEPAKPKQQTAPEKTAARPKRSSQPPPAKQPLSQKPAAQKPAAQQPRPQAKQPPQRTSPPPAPPQPAVTEPPPASSPQVATETTTSPTIEEPPSAAARLRAGRGKKSSLLAGKRKIWLAAAGGGALIVLVGMVYAFSGSGRSASPADSARLVGHWEVDLDTLVADAGLTKGLMRAPARALRSQGTHLNWDFSADGRVKLDVQVADKQDQGSGVWRLARCEGQIYVVAMKWDDTDAWEQVTFEFLDDDRIRAPVPLPDTPAVTFHRTGS